jgi:hypothetical protein
VDKIVFVDNSEFDLHRLSNRFQSENIEWLSFNGLDYPNTYHRGYGEFKLIDHAFSHSGFLRDMDDEDVVWKVTGRYIIKNLGNVIRFAPRKFDLYCDVKKNWVSMEIMAWNKSGYTTYIKGAWEGFTTKMAPELILVDSIKSKLGEGKVCMSYLWPPYIAGRRGTDGGNFIGRFTPIKFGLDLVRKAALWPIRYLSSIVV